MDTHNDGQLLNAHLERYGINNVEAGHLLSLTRQCIAAYRKRKKLPVSIVLTILLCNELNISLREASERRGTR